VPGEASYNRCLLHANTTVAASSAAATDRRITTMERTLKAEVRDATGKESAHKVRAAGRVPAVVYGRGTEPIHVSVDSRELFHLLHTDAGMNVLVDLKVGKETMLIMPREVQRDHIRNRFVHVDFLRIARDQKIGVEVPIQLVGSSPGVREGGVVEHHLWNLQIECFPQDVPTNIEADISGMSIGDALKVADLTLPDTITILSPLDETIVSVVTPQVLRVEEAVPVEAAEGEEGAPAAEGEAAAEGGAAPESAES
jgi:large subunit ribosomal protein L25